MLMLEAVPDLHPVISELATLLRSPIGSEVGFNKSISESTEALKVMGDRIGHLHMHDAYRLLQHTLALPKVLYTLRTSPCFQSPSLQSFDLLLRALLGDRATSISLRMTSLGLKRHFWYGLVDWESGVGPSWHLLPFWPRLRVAPTSSVYCFHPGRLRDTPYQGCEAALRAWRVGHEEPPSLATDHSHQKAWDTPRIKATFKVIKAAAPDTPA